MGDAHAEAVRVDAAASAILNSVGRYGDRVATFEQARTRFCMAFAAISVSPRIAAPVSALRVPDDDSSTPRIF
jgi:hypothetical protein